MAPRPLPHLIAILLVFGVDCASTARQESAANDAAQNESRQRAAMLLEARDYRAAATEIEGLLKSRPKDDELYTLLGDAYRGTGEYDRSVKAYEQAIRLDYGDHRPHLKLGVLLMEHRKTGRALTEFEVAARFGGRDALVHYNQGLALHELGRTEEALAAWQLARELDPEEPDYAAAVGMGLAGKDDAAAVQCFEDAERLGATGALFHNNYGLALERVKDDAAAEEHFRAAVESPDDRREAEYRANLGRHLLRRGRFEEAIREFNMAAARSAASWSVAVYRARAQMELGRFDDAIAGLEAFALDVEAGRIEKSSPRIDRMPPTLAEALDVLGMAYRGKQEHARAVDYLRRAVALAPETPAHLNNYGVVLAEGGMLPEARVLWRRVLALDPENVTAKANLAAFGP